MLGLPSGKEFLAGVERQDSTPDPGWLTRESQRIESVANPGVWVLMSLYSDTEGELLDSVRAAGGQETYAQVGQNVALVRFVFAGPDRGAANAGTMQ